MRSVDDAATSAVTGTLRTVSPAPARSTPSRPAKATLPLVARCSASGATPACAAPAARRALARPCLAASEHPDLVDRARPRRGAGPAAGRRTTCCRPLADWGLRDLLDVSDRRTVGWQLSTSVRTDLALDDVGLWTRQHEDRDTRSPKRSQRCAEPS